MPYGVRRRNNEARQEAAWRLATLLPEEVAQDIADRLSGRLAKEVVAQWRDWRRLVAELLAANAAACRVLVEIGGEAAVKRFEEEAEAAGVETGFGARARQRLQEAGGDVFLKPPFGR